MRPHAPDFLSNDQWAEITGALRLSPREAELVRQANYDERVSVMSARLGLSPNTIHAYRGRLFRKLGVNNFCQVIAIVFGVHMALERERARIGMRCD
jgi:DNA-binding CsgD family transcriptional regulator